MAGLRERFFRSPQLFRRLMNLYPPFLGAGIRVVSVSDDFRAIDVALKLGLGNRNAFGTHFGGSLYAMADPFLALMFAANLGRDYVVWDQSAEIDFERPGRGTVIACFRLGEDDIAQARSVTADGSKYRPQFTVEIRDAQNKRVATVRKQLYIRRAPRKA